MQARQIEKSLIKYIPGKQTNLSLCPDIIIVLQSAQIQRLTLALEDSNRKLKRLRIQQQNLNSYQTQANELLAVKDQLQLKNRKIFQCAENKNDEITDQLNYIQKLQNKYRRSLKLIQEAFISKQQLQFRNQKLQKDINMLQNTLSKFQEQKMIQNKNIISEIQYLKLSLLESQRIIAFQREKAQKQKYQNMLTIQKDKIDLKQQEIDELNRELFILKSSQQQKHQQFNKILMKKQNQIHEYLRQLQRMNAIVLDKMRQTQYSNRKLQQQSQKLKDLYEQYNHLQKQQERYISKNNLYQQQIEQQYKQINKLSTIVSHFSAKINQMNITLDEKKTALSILEATIHHHSQQHQNILNSQKRFHNQICNLQQQTSKLHQEAVLKQRYIKQLQSQLQSIKIQSQKQLKKVLQNQTALNQRLEKQIKDSLNLLEHRNILKAQKQKLKHQFQNLKQFFQSFLKQLLIVLNNQYPNKNLDQQISQEICKKIIEEIDNINQIVMEERGKRSNYEKRIVEVELQNKRLRMGIKNERDQISSHLKRYEEDVLIREKEMKQYKQKAMQLLEQRKKVQMLQKVLQEKQRQKLDLKCRQRQLKYIIQQFESNSKNQNQINQRKVQEQMKIVTKKHQQQIFNFKNQILQKQGKIKQLQFDLKQKEYHLERIFHEQQAHRHQITKQKQQSQSHLRQLEVSRDDKQQMSFNISKLKNQLKILIEESDMLRKQLYSANEQLNSCRQQIQASRSMHEHNKMTIETLLHNKSALQSNFEVIQKNYQQVERLKFQLLRQNERMKQQVELCLNYERSSQQRGKIVGEEIQKAYEMIESLKNRNANLEHDNYKLQVQVEKCKVLEGKVNILSSEIDRLEKERIHSIQENNLYKLSISQQSTSFRAIQQHHILFILLFAEIEALRHRIQAKDKQIQALRKHRISHSLEC